MKKLITILVAVLVGLNLFCTPRMVGATAVSIPILCYHDIGKPEVNVYSVPLTRLREHFQLIKEQGYQVISPGELLAARQGTGILPAKPVMLTFDDGYISFYRDIFPLLREFNYPATLALISSWQQTGTWRDAGPLVNWQQVKVMEESGLVTIASHSHDMHRYLSINPFGDNGQAMTSLAYRNGKYENEVEYKQRIAADMFKTQQVFQSELGHRLSVLVWPYGEYSSYAVEAAKAQGFQLFFALGADITNAVHVSLSTPRAIIYNSPDGKELTKIFTNFGKAEPMRMGQLDIDLLYDTAPAQLEENILQAIDMLGASGVNTVVLQAFADTEGSGNIKSVYFHTTAAPVKKDVFSHVVQRLRTAGFSVYAWMPTLANQWLLNGHPEDEIQAFSEDKKGWYRRATPFSPRVRDELKKLFFDLAAHSPLDGVLFQDDLYMNDFEDTSQAAKKVFKQHFGREMTAELISNKDIQQEWARIKTQVMNDLTLELIAEVRKFRPQAMSARNIYPNVILTPEAEVWMAQNYEDYLRLYDHTIIMAYPYMEKVADPIQWLSQLTKTALSRPGATQKVVFKLQSYDWEKERWVPRRVLSEQVRILKLNGAVHLAYYPLDVYSNANNKLPF